MKSIGFVGFGEAAYNISKGLRDTGADVSITVFDVALEKDPENGYFRTVSQRIEDADVKAVNDVKDLVSSSDVIISAVPAIHSREAAELVLPFMKKGQLFADVTTSSPEIKQELAARFEEKGCSFVDSAMMGPLPVYKHRVPMFASGSGANMWKETMSPLGMSIRIVGETAGCASQIKLSRSVFMKGLEALLVETMMFARKSGIENSVLESLEETMNKVDFRSTATRLITGDTVHSGRRYHELGEAKEALKLMHIEPFVTTGAQERLNRSASMGYRELLGGKTPEDLATVYRLWEKTGLI